MEKFSLDVDMEPSNDKNIEKDIQEASTNNLFDQQWVKIGQRWDNVLEWGCDNSAVEWVSDSRTVMSWLQGAATCDGQFYRARLESII